ncbi:hypothetical protein HCN44_006710 [Aphidius gifuensis]|uniref:Odorant-binding protein n=1 Tax=Aphidius gifuensis TaxID=684658 RepID=A0A834Y0P1_APHGI|nr:hypothetical protein HCN44_006710 [Aphidius gifuensis]
MKAFYFLKLGLLLIQLNYVTPEYTREKFPELDKFTIIKISSEERNYKMQKCTFIIEDDQGHSTSFKLYDADRNIITENWLVYTGDNGKSCSFVIIPEKMTNIFQKKFLYQKWFIEEISADCVFTIPSITGTSCTKIQSIKSYETQNPIY